MLGTRSRAIRRGVSNKGGNPGLRYCPLSGEEMLARSLKLTPMGARPYRVRSRITFLAHRDSLRTSHSPWFRLSEVLGAT